MSYDFASAFKLVGFGVLGIVGICGIIFLCQKIYESHRCKHGSHNENENFSIV